MTIKKIAAGLAVGAAMFGGSLAMGVTQAHASTVLLGNTSVQSTSDSLNTAVDTSEAFGYTAGASGTAHTISVYLTTTGGVHVGLYADDGSNHPAARLDEGNVASGNSTGWVTATLGGNVSISQGTKYWISVGALCSPDSGSCNALGWKDTASGGNADWTGTGTLDPYDYNSQFSSNPASMYVSTS